jgi:hypothetical protein
MSWNDNGDRFEVSVRGSLAFTDDLTDVQSLSDGGYLTIRDWSGIAPRTIEIRSSGGTLTRAYYVAGVSRPWDDEARRRLADSILRLVRRSGFGAEARVKSIFAKKGTAGVLEEIGLLESDYARRVYFVALVDTARPDARAVVPIIEQMSQRMKSDYDRAQVLLRVALQVKLDQRAAAAYVQAVTALRSDYERRRTLSAVLALRPLPAGVADQAIRASVAMTSDYDRSEVLRTALQNTQLEQSDALFEATGRMKSSYEKRRVLAAVIARDALSADLKKGVLMAATSIGSDYDRSMVLQAFVQRHGVDAALRQPFFAAVNTMQSDYEKRRVLSALAAKGGADAETRRGAYDAAGLMRSDHDRAEVLLTFLQAGAVDSSSRQAFVSAAERIRSSYDQNRVLAALVRLERR